MADLDSRSRKSLQRLAKLFNIKANQKSDAIRAALRAHSSQFSSPGAESGETTQSHDENRKADDNTCRNDKDDKAPFAQRRLDNDTSADSVPDDTEQTCGGSSAMSGEESEDDARMLLSPHDAVSLPLPVKEMQQSCSVIDSVAEPSETEEPGRTTQHDRTHSVSLPLPSLPASGPQRRREDAGPAEPCSATQSAFAGTQKTPRGEGSRPHGPGRKGTTPGKKTNTQTLIEKRGIPFAFHHEQAGHPMFARPRVPDPDMAFMGGLRPCQEAAPSYSSHPNLPSHPQPHRPYRQTSSDDPLAHAQMRGSTEMLPSRSAELPYSVPPVRKHERSAQLPAQPGRPEWDTTTTAEIPPLPNRPKTAFPRSTPPPRASASRSTPPTRRRASPARIRPPHSPPHGTNGSRIIPTNTSRGQSLMPHRTPPRITPPSQQSSTPIRGAATRGTPHAPRQRATTSGDSREFEDGEMASCRNAVMSEVLVTSPSVRWSDIAGMDSTKRILQEAVVLPSLRPDIFTGLRAPSRGCLLFGPPGTGKTMLAKAIATEAQATFFSMSASSLTSRYVGRGEKMVRALFEIAESMQPSIIFLDEMDSILSARSFTEHEASRRMKTEFLLRFDGLKPGLDSRVIVIGATNRPADLDEAVCRRLSRRIYVPLPDHVTRKKLLQITLDPQICVLSESELDEVANATDGYSGSDLTSLCKEAAMRPVRELSSDQLAVVDVKSLRPLTCADILGSMSIVRPSVQASVLQSFESWNAEFGSDMASV